MEMFAVAAALAALSGVYALVFVVVRSVVRRWKSCPCPRCLSKWRTRVAHDWEYGEDWHCRACGKKWSKLYRRGSP